MKLVSTVVVDATFHDATTIVNVRPLTPAESEVLGQRTIAPELTEGVTGVGIARCRAEDHYDPTIGITLAATRALRDFAISAEQKVLAAVETERDWEVRMAGEAFAEYLNGVIDAFNDALAAAGVKGGIGAAEAR